MKSWTIVPAAALLVLAACSPSAEQPDAGGTEVAMDPAAATPAPAPVPPPPASRPTADVDAPLLDATSTTSMAITGAARFGRDAYQFGFGQRYAVEDARSASAAEAYSDSGDSWASLLQLPPEATIRIVRVTAEQVPASAPNGGLCPGGGPLRWIATGVKGEGSEARTAMAAFSGDAPPGPAMPERALCGTYSYMPAG